MAWIVCALLVASCSLSSSTTSPHKTAAEQLHHVMTADHRKLFLGMKTLSDHVPDYHVTTPWRTDAAGHYLSRELSPNTRKRRYVSEETSQDESFFKVNVFGEEHALSVRLSRPTPPHSIVQLFAEKGNVSTFYMKNEDCYHIGTATSHNETTAAISTCEGMMGVIKKPNDLVYIHPLPDYLLRHHLNPDNHTHLIYRRSASCSETCGVGERDDPQGYKSGRYEHLPFASSIDQILLDSSPFQSSVVAQFGQLHVEMAIVVDRLVYGDFGNNTDRLRRYILTLVNIMQSTMPPATFGFDIRLHLVRLIILTRDQPDLPLVHDSLALIDSFCKWQRAVNPDNDLENPFHFDFAMLLTGNGLCPGANIDCNELGRAHIAGMCRSDGNCAVAANRGLQIGMVMSHELGHNLGAFHDVKVCPISDGFAMVASQTKVKDFWGWSDCSKAYFRNFLRTEKASCILDCPIAWHGLAHLGNSLPGDFFTRDQQCAMQFPGYKFCSRSSYGRSEICQHLYCDSGDATEGCWTTYTPAADGTKCGRNKVCYRLKCVDNTTDVRKRPAKLAPCQATASVTRGLPEVLDHLRKPLIQHIGKNGVVDGGWEPWGKWSSSCSRSCGGGVRYRIRRCNFPSPANGGKPCKGHQRDFIVCNEQDCPSMYRQSAHGEICASLSNENTGYLLPYRSDKVCKVACYAESVKPVKPLTFPLDLPDGVPCVLKSGEEGQGRCLNGDCVPVQCDNTLNSNTLHDHCGTCGGSGECCKSYNQLVRPQKFSRPGLHNVAILGAGAENVMIREVPPLSKTVSLTLRKLNMGKLLSPLLRKELPVHFSEKLPREFGDVQVTYFRPSDASEVFVLRGRLQQAIRVAVIHDGTKPGNWYGGLRVTYKTMMLDRCTPQHFWKRFETPCSVTCGPGRKIVYFKCTQRSNAQPVENRFCSQLRYRPPRNSTVRCTGGESCNDYHWRVGYWTACTKSCGGGTQTRRLFCYNGNRRRDTKNLDECKKYAKYAQPPARRQCNTELCSQRKLVWVTKKWSPCSATCGKSVQVRVVTCRIILPGNVKINVPPYVCLKHKLPEPAIARNCPAHPRCQRPPPCVDTSRLCAIIRAAGQCTQSLARSLCCRSCR